MKTRVLLVAGVLVVSAGVPIGWSVSSPAARSEALPPPVSTAVLEGQFLACRAALVRCRLRHQFAWEARLQSWSQQRKDGGSAAMPWPTPSWPERLMYEPDPLSADSTNPHWNFAYRPTWSRPDHLRRLRNSCRTIAADARRWLSVEGESFLLAGSPLTNEERALRDSLGPLAGALEAMDRSCASHLAALGVAE